MFDQNPTTNNSVPTNLPTGTSPAPQPQIPPMAPIPTKPVEPEDILADIEPTQASIKGPMEPADEWVKPIMPAVGDEKKVSTKSTAGKFKKIAFISIVAIAIVGVLGVSAWYAYGIFTQTPKAEVVNTNAVNTNTVINNVNSQPSVLEQNTNLINTETNNQVNVDAEPVRPLDTDRDGLSDDEEKMYGTNPNNADTDGDGLTDRDEVKVFHTDPNNVDTDGDSYQDGAEVNSGYDPKGPGKLLQI